VFLGLTFVLAGCGSQSTVGGSASGATGISAQLRQTWNGYKRDFIQSDGQVREVDSHQTTSESQAYGMLRAVWMGDRDEFDAVWQWTRSHLQVRGDGLFAWLWGPDQSNRPVLLGTGSATDADEDIALALIFAGHRWHEPHYVENARAVLTGIWRKEVARLRGDYYVTAGDWAPQGPDGPVLNPSYLQPYAYPIFAKEDRGHPWNSLVASSYRALQQCSSAKLDGRISVGLPPNWCVLDPKDGSAKPFNGFGPASGYGYDAFRVMWRVALDYQWNRSPQAKSYLERSSYLRQQWKDRGRILTLYRHDGLPDRGANEDTTIYAGDIGNFLVTDPSSADSMVRDKLLPSYRERDGAAYWADRYNYFQQNWIWFGVALAAHQLPNLAV
jgi:endoglucanase